MKKNVYHVNNLSKVDTSRYREGDLFLTKQIIALLHNGKLENMLKQSDLKDYVKKREVKKMINDYMKEGGKHE